MMRIGIFGGTFDPPHLGHLILAEEAKYQLHLDTVLWVLTPLPPHKQNQTITPVEKRISMVRISIEDNESFIFSDVEIKKPPPYYSVDTVDLLRKNNPKAKLIFLMGADALRGLTKWKQVDAFVKTCNEIGVMLRPGTKLDLSILEKEIPDVIPKLRFIHAPMIEISSHEIRRRIIAGEPVRYFLKKEVYGFIKGKHIYK
jgi:nicotinate-nucleotide adenylyltransferase